MNIRGTPILGQCVIKKSCQCLIKIFLRKSVTPQASLSPDGMQLKTHSKKVLGVEEAAFSESYTASPSHRVHRSDEFVKGLWSKTKAFTHKA